jgi:hypothetical protein
MNTKTSIFDQLNLNTDLSGDWVSQHDQANQAKAKFAIQFIKENAPFQADLMFSESVVITPELKEATVFMAMWIRHYVFYPVKVELFNLDADAALFADKELTRAYEINFQLNHNDPRITEATDFEFLELASRIKGGLMDHIKNKVEYYLNSARSSSALINEVL